MGLNRLLTKSGETRQEWQDTLDRSLRVKGWRDAFYATEVEADLFEGTRNRKVKDATPEKLEQFYLDRLRTIFPTVMRKCVRLTNSKNQTMYLLCFASANPSSKVKALATKLAGAAAKV